MFVAQADQTQRIGVSLALPAVGGIGFVQLFAGDKCVGNVAEGRLHSRLIIHNLNLLLDFGVIQIGFVAAPVENRQIDGRRKRPCAVAAFKQAAQFGRTRAYGAGQADAGEKRRARRADIGIGFFQIKLGGTDVGPVQQYF